MAIIKQLTGGALEDRKVELWTKSAILNFLEVDYSNKCAIHWTVGLRPPQWQKIIYGVWLYMFKIHDKHYSVCLAI